jgi:hypothetical protein
LIRFHQSENPRIINETHRLQAVGRCGRAGEYCGVPLPTSRRREARYAFLSPIIADNGIVFNKLVEWAPPTKVGK